MESYKELIEVNQNRIQDPGQIFRISIFRSRQDNRWGYQKTGNLEYCKRIYVDKQLNILFEDHKMMPAYAFENTLRITSHVCGVIIIKPENLRPGISLIEDWGFLYTVEITVHDHIPLDRVPRKTDPIKLPAESSCVII